MMDSTELPIPAVGREAALAWVSEHLVGYYSGATTGSTRFSGGQRAADEALSEFDVDGYARQRNEVLPESARGASGLSPYIRHGLLPLRRVWDHVAGGPRRDVEKFRDELLWQEFARHWYARLGVGTRHGIRREPTRQEAGNWDRSMACVDFAVGELERDGWLVNQTRMWLASVWTVRQGGRWQDGDDLMFRHLLDGSRAANRLGWQWTTGAASSKHYGFSRWQVERRAPQLCTTCTHRAACPIQDWPDDPEFEPSRGGSERRGGAADLVGPVGAPRFDARRADDEIDTVWLTAESLGLADPALAAHPGAAAVFVFDRALLAKLGLTAKRLVFLVETLAEIASIRQLTVSLGDAGAALADRHVAVTHAPVPGFAAHVAAVQPAAIHPWPWLMGPGPASVSSFSTWRRRVRLQD